MLLRCERAERRAAAVEEEMTEMARQSAREIAGLKVKLAEKDAQLMGGFGPSSNLALGDVPRSDDYGHDYGHMSSEPPPGGRLGSGGRRRQLEPLH